MTCVECKDQKAIWIKATWIKKSDGSSTEELLCEKCYNHLRHANTNGHVEGSQYKET
jgi:protein-arginine kinase activator protein McsA